MSQLRFHISKGNKVTTTNWEPETVKVGPGSTAAARATALRAEHGPEAAIMIERRGDDRTPNPLNQFRCRIKVGDILYYSRVYGEREREAIMAVIKNDYPKAEISEEQI